MNTWNRSPGDMPETVEIPTRIPVEIFSTGWQVALQRPPRIDINNISMTTPSPRAVSIPIRDQEVRTWSFAFPDSPGGNAAPVAPQAAGPAPPRVSATDFHDPSKTHDSESGDAPRHTRIRPPKDIIKLEDRLYYLLQAPLETLCRDNSLTFPFEPFPYQYEGVAFLYPRHEAILADEMGLGKTMQAVTTIRLLLRAGEMRRILLVCPKPLVTNWQREFALWAPEIPVSIIEGDQQRRHWQWQLPDTPVSIANYELILRDEMVVTDADQHYDLVVLDEAQRIKNRSSSTSRAIRSINRTRSWALTGTPVENSTEDLLGIFEFLAPGYLCESLNARGLGRATRDYTLRRTKDMVLTDLPPKMFRDAEIDLSPEQRISYEMAEQEGVVRLNDMGEDVSIQHVFELVLRLKQICNIDPATGSSSKLERLEADLEEVAASGQKAIVFSQWVQTLEHIADRLKKYNPLQYHGKIPTGKRDDVIRRFRETSDHSVILMSYGAGAVGLNLQFCGYVFLFDRWWNPAVEDQAINRAHRIGASGPVTVSRFLALNTIEERIDLVLQEKRQLFDTIFSNNAQPKNVGMTQSEIFGLFNLDKPKQHAKKAA